MKVLLCFIMLRNELGSFVQAPTWAAKPTMTRHAKPHIPAPLAACPHKESNEPRGGKKDPPRGQSEGSSGTSKDRSNHRRTRSAEIGPHLKKQGAPTHNTGLLEGVEEEGGACPSKREGPITAS
jgi:hypothetical protein